jgi:hypothetical protein
MTHPLHFKMSLARHFARQYYGPFDFRYRKRNEDSFGFEGVHLAFLTITLFVSSLWCWK